MSYKNFHMSLTPNRSAVVASMTDDQARAAVVWTCDYCGTSGPIDQMTDGGCPREYPVCEHCGGCEDSNECKPDCAGIAAILNRPDVYVAGDDTEDPN